MKMLKIQAFRGTFPGKWHLKITGKYTMIWKSAGAGNGLSAGSGRSVMHPRNKSKGVEDMGDTYVEWMVKRVPSMPMKILKVVLITVTVIAVLFAMIGLLPAFVVAIAAGIGAYFAHMNANLEYEYLYVDKELTIDKIMAQTKRKRIAQFDLERMEILAPIKSWHMDDYAKREIKTVDYSSGVEQQPDKRYVMIYNGEKKVILEPNEALVKAVQSIAPRKVFMD